MSLSTKQIIIHCVTDEEPALLKVTQLLKIRFEVRVICTQILRLPGCHCVTLDEGFNFSVVHFFRDKMRRMLLFLAFVRIKDAVGQPLA